MSTHAGLPVIGCDRGEVRYYLHLELPHARSMPSTSKQVGELTPFASNLDD